MSNGEKGRREREYLEGQALRDLDQGNQEGLLSYEYV